MLVKDVFLHQTTVNVLFFSLSLITLFCFHRSKAAKVADILRKKMSTVATNDDVDDDEDKEEESEAVDKNENKIDAKKLTRKEAAQELFLQVTYCTINITNLSDYFD